MKKINIVKNNRDFKKVIDQQQCLKNNYFLIHYGTNNLNHYRFGISISKKLGKAVTRNYYKRIVRNIVDNHKKLYSNNNDYIIIIRKACIGASYKDMEDAFIKLINIIEKESENEEKH